MFGPASFAQGASTTGAAPIGGSGMFSGGAGGAAGGGGMMAAWPAAIVAAIAAKAEYNRKNHGLSLEDQLKNPSRSMHKDIDNAKLDKIFGNDLGGHFSNSMKAATDFATLDFSNAGKSAMKSIAPVKKGVKGVGNFLSKLF
jgi:hypothetical protein